MTTDPPTRRTFEQLRQDLLAAVTRRVCRQPALVILVAVAVALFSAYWTATHLKFKTNRNDLVRADSHTHELFLDYMKEFRSDEDFIIVVEGANVERNRACVEAIAARLREQPEVFPSFFYRIDFSSLDDRLLFYLTQKQLDEIHVSQQSFAEVVERLGSKNDLVGLLKNANELMDPDRLQKEGEFEKMQPFLDSFIENLVQLGDYLEGKRKELENLAEIFTGGSELADLARDAKNHEYVSFEEGKVFLLLVNPKPDDNEFTRFDVPLRSLRTVVRDARADFPGVNIGLTGEPVLDNDEMEASATDSAKASALTLVLIAILFAVSYREFTRPLLAIVNLLVATAWTMGFTTLAVGHLNILTVTFVVMIFGLGIDFGIQILGRYEEELSRGASVEHALLTTVSHTGNAILTGALVTAGGFFTMTLNEFIGLAELGIIAGGGMLLTFLSTVTFLPALLMVCERNRPRTKTLHYHAGFAGTARLEQKWLQYPWVVLSVAAVLTAISAFNALHVRFDHNVLNLQAKGIESVVYERRLIKSPSRSTIFAAAIYTDIETARRQEAALERLASVSDVVGPPDFIPDNQAEKVPFIERIKAELKDVNLVSGELAPVNLGEYKGQLGSLRDKMKTYSHFAEIANEKEASEIFARLIPPMDRVLKLLNNLPMAEAADKLTAYQNSLLPELQKHIDWLRNHDTSRFITLADIPASLKKRYVGHTGKLLLEVFPRENVWEREPLGRFVHELKSVDPNITGTPVQLYYYVNLLKTSYEQAALYALGAVVIMIFLHFRNVVATLLTLVPLAVGCVWTVGWMRLHALPFNPANIIALPLMVGIGIAFGVYLVDRYRETGTAGSFGNSTGRAILLSALTTMIGFGSLIPAQHRGIASLGALMTGAVGLCLLSALVVLPPILEIFRRRGWKL